jgi:hypothetical protein
MRSEHSCEGLRDIRQGDEGEVGYDEVHAIARPPLLIEVGWDEVPDVRALTDDHSGIAPQPMVELAVADVDRVDDGCTTLEQAIREAPGRRTSVEDHQALAADPEVGERPVELLAATGDESSRRRAQVERISARDLSSGVGCNRPANED